MNISKRQVSIDAALPGHEELTLMDLIEDRDRENADSEQNNKSLRKELEAAIAKLPSHEADILRLCFGLDDKKPLSFDDISLQLGIGRDRVRCIKEKALLRLKHTSRSKFLKEYLG